MAPAEEYEPTPPSGIDGSRYSTPVTIANVGRSASATREISMNFSLLKLASFTPTKLGSRSIRRDDQVAGELDAGEVAGRVVGDQRQVDRRAEPHEVVVDRFDRRVPEVRA